MFIMTIVYGNQWENGVHVLKSITDKCDCPKCGSKFAHKREFEEASMGSLNQHEEIVCQCGYFSTTLDY